jgi:GT2 family glycosyltransferase
VILAYHRDEELEIVLERLGELPVDEIVVVDNGGTVQERANVQVIHTGENIGAAGRNLGARAATGELLLMLDDDSYPLPGCIETLQAALDAEPRLAVAGGLVRNVDRDGRVVKERELGTFDWFFRAGRRGAPPPAGWPTFFFPEGACMMRRDAFLEVGGYLDEYFMVEVEVDLTTRLVGAGWEVRYVPGALFDHMKPAGGPPSARVLRHRVRNQIWYFWLHFPPGLAARRIIAYTSFYFIECASYGQVGAWAGGISDAWSQRALVRRHRRPLPRDVLRRAELNRGRLHLRLLVGQLRKRLR